MHLLICLMTFIFQLDTNLRQHLNILYSLFSNIIVMIMNANKFIQNSRLLCVNFNIYILKHWDTDIQTSQQYNMCRYRHTDVAALQTYWLRNSPDKQASQQYRHPCVAAVETRHSSTDIQASQQYIYTDVASIQYTQIQTYRCRSSTICANADIYRRRSTFRCIII